MWRERDMEGGERSPGGWRPDPHEGGVGWKGARGKKTERVEEGRNICFV